MLISILVSTTIIKISNSKEIQMPKRTRRRKDHPLEKKSLKVVRNLSKELERYSACFSIK
jgi:hypothetical protein